MTEGFTRLRAAGQWLNAVIGFIALALILASANYLSQRHFKRVDLAEAADRQLSPLTKQVLDVVTNEVRMIVYFDRREPVYKHVIELLRQYEQINSHLTLEVVDYEAKPVRAAEVAVKYKLPINAKDLVIFDATGRTHIVSSGELSNYAYSDVIRSASGDYLHEIKRTGFKGERLFTSALVAVSDSSPKLAYYLTGHGEHDSGNFNTDGGYGKFAAMLSEIQVPLIPVTLTGTNQVPPDCKLLIVAGPQSDLHPEELLKLNAYLVRGGRLLALFHFNTRAGLDQLMEKWNVRVGENTVIDYENSRPNGALVATRFGNHPVVRPISAAQLPLQLVFPRTLDERDPNANKADAPQVRSLIETGPNSVAFRDYFPKTGPKRPVEEKRGAQKIALAVDRAGVPGLADSSTRLVIVGDSFIFNNQLLDAAANRDFAWHSVNWLLDRSQTLNAIGPRPIKEHTVSMTQKQIRRLSGLLVGIIPGATLCLGMMVWFRRSR
ncbi:MAG: hypothetical protein EXS24_01320 [Pedosphaera sp.]|nr:hypothetical protein [Pedosphaera sp.]